MQVWPPQLLYRGGKDISFHQASNGNRAASSHREIALNGYIHAVKNTYHTYKIKSVVDGTRLDYEWSFVREGLGIPFSCSLSCVYHESGTAKIIQCTYIELILYIRMMSHIIVRLAVWKVVSCSSMLHNYYGACSHGTHALIGPFANEYMTIHVPEIHHILQPFWLAATLLKRLQHAPTQLIALTQNKEPEKPTQSNTTLLLWLQHTNTLLELAELVWHAASAWTFKVQLLKYAKVSCRESILLRVELCGFLFRYSRTDCLPLTSIWREATYIATSNHKTTRNLIPWTSIRGPLMTFYRIPTSCFLWFLRECQWFQFEFWCKMMRQMPSQRNMINELVLFSIECTTPFRAFLLHTTHYCYYDCSVYSSRWGIRLNGRTSTVGKTYNEQLLVSKSF